MDSTITPVKVNRGGQPRHAAWTGYNVVEGVKAECKFCSYVYTKTCFKTLNNHTLRCSKNPNAKIVKAEQNQSKPNGGASIDRSVNKQRSLGMLEAQKGLNDSLAKKRLSADSSVFQQNESISPAKNRRSIENLESQKIMNKAKRDDALMKLFLRLGASFDSLDSVHLKHFIDVFDELYEIPKSDEMENVIIPQALDNYVVSKSEVMKSNVMFVQCFLCESGKSIAASYLIDHEHRYIGIGCKIVELFDANSFDDFCQYSVEECVQMYKVLISFIVHNTRFDCPDIEYSKSHSVQYIQSLSILMRDLQNEYQIDDSTPDDEAVQNERRISILNNLREKISRENAAGLATKYIMDLLEDEEFDCKESTKELINNSLQTVHFACEFLIPKFRMKYIRNDETRTGVNRFMLAKLKTMESVSDYLNEMGNFFEYFKSPGVDDTFEFWQFAMTKEKSISKFALDLYSIPALPKLINLSEFAALYDPSWETDEMMRTLALIVFLEDQELFFE
ncbi:hypothetical protein QAD02_014950 [Eretmocerus hayati]|uniref:Uncharacterized protein n=1 Tax=Eretmocerus hayati TaxID=131215 RepID=A0ACC2P6Y8_9HYME|nr:hypothetical protein QAD02_014950 [Eretmocerus hayati]